MIAERYDPEMVEQNRAQRVLDGVEVGLVLPDLDDRAVDRDFCMPCHMLSSRSGMPCVAPGQANAGITSLTNSSKDRFCSFMPRPRLA